MSVGAEQEWIVVLECTRAGVGTRREELPSVMASLRDLSPTGLTGEDRYALQMHVFTPTAPDAVRLATTQWEQALTELGLPRGDLVRAEVLTPDEFEWECDNGQPTMTHTVEPPPPRPGNADIETGDPLSSVLRDSVTGLVAWDLLRHHLEYSLASAGRDEKHALLLVDVERDGSGLSEIDVEPVARRLERLLRSADIVARVVGSRFAVLLEDTSEQVAAAVARRLASWGATGRDDGSMNVSVGFVLSEPGDDGATLLGHAVNALGHARRRGSPQPFDRSQGS